jgi:ABC-type lipoprotein release transport system permease subunit
MSDLRDAMRVLKRSPGFAAVVVLALTLAAAALVAGWLPARAASRLDPLSALRHE